ncbi:MAG TPA: Spy/CpxP family protein refolding chaperone [Opitutaceae bacterium]|nr:Spy/CpxP family protein refolding chaperone [Opitutaceae bacterium]
MKSSKLLFAASFALVALSVPSIHAQNSDRPARGGRGEHMVDRVKHLSQELSLTDAQQTQVKAVYAEQAKEMKAVMDDTSLSDQDRRTKRMEIMRGVNGKIRDVLTPEQQAKFDKMQAAGPGGQGKHGRGKKAKSAE